MNSIIFGYSNLSKSEIDIYSYFVSNISNIKTRYNFNGKDISNLTPTVSGYQRHHIIPMEDVISHKYMIRATEFLFASPVNIINLPNTLTAAALNGTDNAASTYLPGIAYTKHVGSHPLYNKKIDDYLQHFDGSDVATQKLALTYEVTAAENSFYINSATENDCIWGHTILNQNDPVLQNSTYVGYLTIGVGQEFYEEQLLKYDHKVNWGAYVIHKPADRQEDCSDITAYTGNYSMVNDVLAANIKAISTAANAVADPDTAAAYANQEILNLTTNVDTLSSIMSGIMGLFDQVSTAKSCGESATSLISSDSLKSFVKSLNLQHLLSSSLVWADTGVVSADTMFHILRSTAGSYVQSLTDKTSSSYAALSQWVDQNPGAAAVLGAVGVAAGVAVAPAVLIGAASLATMGVELATESWMIGSVSTMMGDTGWVVEATAANDLGASIAASLADGADATALQAGSDALYDGYAAMNAIDQAGSTWLETNGGTLFDGLTAANDNTAEEAFAASLKSYASLPSVGVGILSTAFVPNAQASATAQELDDQLGTTSAVQLSDSDFSGQTNLAALDLQGASAQITLGAEAAAAAGSNELSIYDTQTQSSSVLSIDASGFGDVLDVFAGLGSKTLSLPDAGGWVVFSGDSDTAHSSITTGTGAYFIDSLIGNNTLDLSKGRSTVTINAKGT